LPILTETDSYSVQQGSVGQLCIWKIPFSKPLLTMKVCSEPWMVYGNPLTAFYVMCHSETHWNPLITVPPEAFSRRLIYPVIALVFTSLFRRT
jgi:hypothetical protein